MGVVTSADNLFGYLVRQLEEFDPRFDKRVGEQEKLRNLQVGKELTNDPNAVPTIKLSELEGQDFITSMSDRTEAHGSLLDINGVPLNRPVQQRGGQGFMFDNPGLVWASGTNPVNQIMDAASGQRVNYMPWGMAPTGGDFATSTGETMLAYASSAMSKAEKAEFDKAIRDYVTVGKKVKGEDGVSRQTGQGLSIKDWPGVDSPEAIKVWESTPDSVRKELMNMMDKRFRNSGGLGIGEARLANVDPRQANRPDGSLLNVGTIHGDKQAVRGIDNPSYPDGVPGEGQGTLDQQVNVFELLPDVVKERKIPDPQNPRPSDLRALQMKPYRGTVTPEVLKALQARGVDVGNADPKLLAALAAGTAGAGSLLMSEDADAGVSSFFRHAPDAARTFAGRVPGDSKAPNPKKGRTRSGLPTNEAAAKLATDLDDAIKSGASQKDLELLVGNFIHGDTDYNQWVRKMGEVDGGKDGAAYLTGTDIINEELKELLPERHHGLIDSYTQFRLGPKEQGRPWTKAAGLESRAGEGFGDKSYYDSLWGEATTPQAPANSAMADALKRAAVEESPRRSKVDRSNLKKGLLGGGGAAGAGAANSQELGFREWPTAPVPTSPEERGFGQPLPTYDELMAEKNKPLPLPTGGDVVDSIFTILGTPMTGLQGTARGLFGLATGEGLAGAAAEAANTMDVGWNNGRANVRGINPDKGADQFEGYVTDVTGDPSLGWMAKMGLMLGGI